MRGWTTKVLSWLVTGLGLLIRATCRNQLHGDPRPELRRQGTPYVYALLHAHQLAVLPGAEPGTAAMVSQSRDGDLVVEVLRRCGLVVYRGSKRSGQRDRGGRDALQQLIEHLRRGAPAALTVDGPRGPRGRVHQGVVKISQSTGAAILPTICVPRWRLIAFAAWDRLQIPLPLTRIDTYFAEPLLAQPGEKPTAFRRRVEVVIQQLEAAHDRREAARCRRHRSVAQSLAAGEGHNGEGHNGDDDGHNPEPLSDGVADRVVA